MTSEERERLDSFLNDIELIFQDIVAWRAILFRDEMREPIQQAWEEVRPSLSNVRRYLTSTEFDRQLEAAGLTGAQLNLKMTGYEIAVKDFQQWGTVGRLVGVLDWINTLLKSILSALPGGDSLVEFKEAIENSIQEPG